jgi:hypothetical protein
VGLLIAALLRVGAVSALQTRQSSRMEASNKTAKA